MTHVEKRELAKRQICPASTVEEMLSSTPPAEIGTGHDKLVGRNSTRLPVPRGAGNFGTLGRGRAAPAIAPQEGARTVAARGEDKRTGREPQPANVPVREGGVKFF